MKKEDLFNDEFLKQFKSGDKPNGFLKQLQKRGIEKMLEGELDGHLGYEKSQKSDNPNTRNGFAQKKVRTSFGESKIQVPRDRDASFNPMIVPKRGNMVDGIENVIVSLYTKGMSNTDIEEQIREVYNFEVSTSTISRITEGHRGYRGLAKPSTGTSLPYCLDGWYRIQGEGELQSNQQDSMRQ